jgi:hypothetical protein
MSGSRSVTTAQPSPPRRRAEQQTLTTDTKQQDTEQQTLNNKTWSYATPVTSPPLPVPRPGSRAAAPPPGGGRTFLLVAFPGCISMLRFQFARHVAARLAWSLCNADRHTPINPILLGVRLDVVRQADDTGDDIGRHREASRPQARGHRLVNLVARAMTKQ